MIRIAFFFVCIACIHGVATSIQRGKLAPICNNTACVLPNCRCISTDIPGGLPSIDTPQTVLLSFDDDVNLLNYVNYTNLIFNRYNPNGCPIKATYFLSHEYSNYTLANELYNRGHEIASHSITHRENQTYWLSGNVLDWEREIADMRLMIEQYASIPLTDIRGARAPFLLSGGDEMWTALSNNNFEWDCSWPTRNFVDPGLWPYTLDYMSLQDCQVGRCPLESYPGKWVVPIVDLFDANNNPCAMIDACIFGSTADDIYTVLMNNFNMHYNGNRSPFGLFVHASWLQDENHLLGYEKFLNALARKADVYLVSISQLLQWVKSPTPLNNIASFAPWGCPGITQIPCTVKNCVYSTSTTPFGSERSMPICNKACPPYYPWYGNIYGTDPSTPWNP